PAGPGRHWRPAGGGVYDAVCGAGALLAGGARQQSAAGGCGRGPRRQVAGCRADRPLSCKRPPSLFPPAPSAGLLTRSESDLAISYLPSSKMAKTVVRRKPIRPNSGEARESSHFAAPRFVVRLTGILVMRATFVTWACLAWMATAGVSLVLAPTS